MFFIEELKQKSETNIGKRSCDESMTSAEIKT